MIGKWDKVVEKMLFIMGLLLSNTDKKFAACKLGDQNRRMLRLLKRHDLARPVREKDGNVVWTATERLVSLAGDFTRGQQPNPVQVPVDESYAGTFERHMVRYLIGLRRITRRRLICLMCYTPRNVHMNE